MEGEPPEEATLFPTTVGEKLRAAREAQGVDLADIATRTRIPLRHLEAIERGNYAQLPSATYALGFTKAYARAVDADEVAIARDLRVELGDQYEHRPAPTSTYEMRDANRTPSRGLAWIMLLVAVLVLAGVGVWYGTDWFRGSAPAPEGLVVPEPSPSPTPSAQPTVAGGQVSLVALDSVWLQVHDATGKILFEKQMAAGERYDVPPDADHPVAKTARADKIQVTVNGSNVAPLGPSTGTVEAAVSADALLARGTATATPTPAPTPTPTPSPTRAPVVLRQPPIPNLDPPTAAAPAKPTPVPTAAPAPAPQ